MKERKGRRGRAKPEKREKDRREREQKKGREREREREREKCEGRAGGLGGFGFPSVEARGRRIGWLAAMTVVIALK